MPPYSNNLNRILRPGARGAMGRLKRAASCQIVGIRWAVGVQRCSAADDRTRRDLGEDQSTPSIIWILLRPPERQDRYPIDLPWILVMSFQVSSKQIGVALRHVRQVMPCSVLPRNGAYAGIWLSRRRPSQGNHPTSPLRAASVPVASQTRWRDLHPRSPEKGQNILIHGGAGAVGAYACNWHRMPCHRHCTASGDDEAYLNSIGATGLCDYREAQFEKVMREKSMRVFD